MTDERIRQLLRARAMRDLTAAEVAELEARAAADPTVGGEVAAWDEVESALGAETALRVAVMAPVEGREELDETYGRLGKVAASAESDLRARLLHGPTVTFVPRGRRLGRWLPWAAVVAAAAAAALLFLTGKGGAPELMNTAPKDLRAGAAVNLILLNPTLSADNHTLSWSAVAGAAGYDAVVVDGSADVVLARPEDQRRSTLWELSIDEFARLRRLGSLALRVRALDGTGIPVGTSGDLPLTVR